MYQILTLGNPGTPVMTIFVSHVDPHIPNIGYMKVYEGYRPWGYLIFSGV